MLHSTKELEAFRLVATDGDIGSIMDFYFDDEAWAVRFLAVDTSHWLGGRKVLVSPMSFDHSRPTVDALNLSISKTQLRDSPVIDTQKPVSRQHEMGYLGYYGYPYYWGGSGVWGQFALPGMLAGSAYGMPNFEYRRVRASAEQFAAEAEARVLRDSDSHLRSCNAVEHYHVHATDGNIGHIDGFMVDDESWVIRYVIVNTSNWWLGHQVLLVPAQIGEISWEYKKITTSLSRQSIRDAPMYDQALLASDRSDSIPHSEHSDVDVKLGTVRLGSDV